VGTPRAQVKKTRAQWESLAWQKIKDTVEVKLFHEQQELYVVAKSTGRRQKEIAMRRQKLARLLWALRGMRRETSRDQLLMRLGAAKHRAGRAYGFVKIKRPEEGEAVSRQTFSFALDRKKLRTVELYDGHYLLRSNLTDKEPAWLWQLYILLVEVEAVFRSFKNDLLIRPVYHQLEGRAEAHIFVCFLAYCLWVTLKKRLQALAPGLTPRSALDQLAGIQMLDVEMPTTDGRWLTLTRYTQPSPTVRLLLERLHWQLPEQPPPRLSERRELQVPTQKCSEDLSPTPPVISGDSATPYKKTPPA
jgi:hypothetical protein